MPDNIKIRPLNKVMEFVDSTAHKVTYVFDDLVFIEHSEIILQFCDTDENQLYLFIHKDIQEKDKEQIKKTFITKGNEFDLQLKYNGSFELIEKIGEENIDVKFYPLTER